MKIPSLLLSIKYASVNASPFINKLIVNPIPHNSDINFSDVTMSSVYSPLSMGVILGLLLGKPIGITLFT